MKKVIGDLQKNDVGRRKIIRAASDSLHIAKQAIFSLHRGDIKSAEEKLAGASAGLKFLDEEFAKNKSLRQEGTWRAAVEEFVEAKLFCAFIKGDKISAIKEAEVMPDEYLGGLSDLTGEILRFMVIATTRKEIDRVKQAGAAISDIIAELMQANLTGYLRTKFDQAKKNLQRAEQILYDLSLRDLD